MKAWVVPIDASLELIFTWCVRERRVDRLLLSARLEKKGNALAFSDPPVETAVALLFGHSLIERRTVRRWPGTELIGHEGAVFRIAFQGSTIGQMAKTGKLLSDWQHSNRPPLPEDPCLYREGDEWPVLVSVTHEGDAWILSEERPPFCKMKSFEHEDLLIPSAEDGFIGI